AHPDLAARLRADPPGAEEEEKEGQQPQPRLLPGVGHPGVGEKHQRRVTQQVQVQPVRLESVEQTGRQVSERSAETAGEPALGSPGAMWLKRLGATADDVAEGLPVVLVPLLQLPL